MKDTQRKSVLVATPRFIYVSFLFTLTSNIFPSKKCFMHFYDISSNVFLQEVVLIILIFLVESFV